MLPARAPDRNSLSEIRSGRALRRRLTFRSGREPDDRIRSGAAGKLRAAFRRVHHHRRPFVGSG